MLKNILITGLPRSGKTTILEEVVAEYKDKVGFITKEVRKDGKRTGFEIITNLGKKIMLADVDFKTDYRVSKYFVDKKNLESIIPEISIFTEKDVLFLDEIGQMELFSEKFRQLVIKFLNSENIFLATLTKVYKDDFIDSIKKREDIIIIEISEKDREIKKQFIKDLVKKIVKAKNYINEPERFKRKGSMIEMKSEHGLRKLIYSNGKWSCDCSFFVQNQICSHIIAVAELMRLNKI